MEENVRFHLKSDQTEQLLCLERNIGDVVRVIKFGDSIELCGGTHVENTSDIVMFKLQSESSSAAGIRRIEATSGSVAIDELKETYHLFMQMTKELKNPKDPLDALKKILDENKELNNQLEQFKLQQAKSEKENWKNSFQTINGINFLAVKTNLMLNHRQIAFPLRKELDNVFLVVASDADAKPTITVSISDNWSK